MSAVEEIRERVDKLQRRVEGGTEGDPECHIEEDAIAEEALRLISEGCEEPAEVARQALRTGDLDFSRWYE